MNKRALLSSLICRPGIHPVMAGISNRRYVRILAYHRVLDIDEQTYPFDCELISASVRDFERQMEHVCSRYRVVTFADLEEYEQNNERIPENTLIITFDDGYADNYEQAFPILERYGHKAVFFLSTDYIGTDTPFWFERLAYLVKKGMVDTSRLDLGPCAGIAGKWRDHRGVLPQEGLYHAVIRLPNRDRLRLLRQIEEGMPPLPKDEAALVRPLTWDQVRQMADHGMEIGSHTRSHLILGNGSPGEVAQELEVSRRTIEEQISRPVRAVSYPIASYDFAINPLVIKLVQLAGYRFGVGYTSGPVRRLTRERYQLKRLKIERYVSFDRFRAKLLFPGLFA